MVHKSLNKTYGGWIYVVYNTEDLYSFKVGRTENHPVKRFKELRTSAPYLALHVAYFIPNSLGFKLSDIEREIHYEFKNSLGELKFHDEKSSEWFYGEARTSHILIDIWFEEHNFIVTDCHIDYDMKILRFWGSVLEQEYYQDSEKELFPEWDYEFEWDYYNDFIDHDWFDFGAEAKHAFLEMDEKIERYF